MHNKDRGEDDLRRFVCASPLYDPNDPAEKERIESSSPLTHAEIPQFIKPDLLDRNPGFGTIHF